MRKFLLVLGVVLSLTCFCSVASALNFCDFTTTQIFSDNPDNGQAVFVNAGKSFTVEVEVASICGPEEDEGTVCVYVSNGQSLTRISCVDVDDEGEAHVTVKGSQYNNHPSPTQNQYVFAVYFPTDNDDFPSRSHGIPIEIN